MLPRSPFALRSSAPTSGKIEEINQDPAEQKRHLGSTLVKSREGTLGTHPNLVDYPDIATLQLWEFAVYKLTGVFIISQSH